MCVLVRGGRFALFKAGLLPRVGDIGSRACGSVTLTMSQPADRMHSKRAGIRAAVVLIGLLHKSRKQNKEKR